MLALDLEQEARRFLDGAEVAAEGARNARDAEAALYANTLALIGNGFATLAASAWASYYIENPR